MDPGWQRGKNRNQKGSQRGKRAAGSLLDIKQNVRYNERSSPLRRQTSGCFVGLKRWVLDRCFLRAGWPGRKETNGTETVAKTMGAGAEFPTNLTPAPAVKSHSLLKLVVA